MTSNERERLAVVRTLLELSKPLDDISTQLSKFGWDYEGEGVELTKEHVVSVLQRYLEGKLSSTEIDAWANRIEGREDVYFEATYEDAIENILYELANPEITQPLTSEIASLFINQLL